MPTKHLCVGSLALNDTVYADGRTSMADPGGNALYAAVGANIWSDQVGIVAVAGYDWPAEYTDQLAHSGIDLSGLVYKDEETLRAWTIYELSGFRRYVSRNTEVVLLTPSPYSSRPASPLEVANFNEAARQVHLRSSPLPQELPPQLWEVDSIHLCPMRMERLLTWIDFLKGKPDIFVSIDILPHYVAGNFDDHELVQLLSRADAFMPSEAEVESLMPHHNLAVFCREMAARGPKLVVVKQGDHGATVYDRAQDRFYTINPYPAEVDDLTGAGDSFCGGYAIGYAKTKDPVKAAWYGTVSASFVIEGFGGLHALNTTKAEAETRLEELHRLNRIIPA